MTARRRRILTALLVAVGLVPPTPAPSQNPRRTIVALLAHADDETAAGPALARYAREGAQVWNGAVAFVPASPALSGDDLFRK